MNILFCFRYTLFIVLYPMGVSGELLTIYAALPFVRQAGLYSISLPNKYNFSFDYYAFLILIMISYIPSKQIFMHIFIYVLKIGSTIARVKCLWLFLYQKSNLSGTLWFSLKLTVRIFSGSNWIKMNSSQLLKCSPQCVCLKQ